MIASLLISKVLFNKYVWLGVVIGVILIGTFMAGRASMVKQEQKEVIRVITKYVQDRDNIDHKYEKNFDDEYVLSGCVPEAAKEQEHCK